MRVKVILDYPGIKQIIRILHYSATGTIGFYDLKSYVRQQIFS